MFFNDNQYNNVKVERLGVPDRLIQHAHIPELLEECGYDEEAIYKTIINKNI